MEYFARMLSIAPLFLALGSFCSWQSAEDWDDLRSSRKEAVAAYESALREGVQEGIKTLEQNVMICLNTAHFWADQQRFPDEEVERWYEEDCQRFAPDNPYRLFPLFRRAEFYVKRADCAKAEPMLAELEQLYRTVEHKIEITDKFVGNMSVWIPLQRGRYFMQIGLIDQCAVSLQQGEQAAQELGTEYRADARTYYCNLKVRYLFAQGRNEEALEAIRAGILERWKGDPPLENELLSARELITKHPELFPGSLAMTGHAVNLATGNWFVERDTGTVRMDTKSELTAALEVARDRSIEAFLVHLWLAERGMLYRQFEDARASLSQARERAISSLDRARLAGLEVEIALSSGVGLDQAVQAHQAAEQEFLEAWRQAPPRESGLNFLQYSGRRAYMTTGVGYRLQGATDCTQALEFLMRFHALSSLAQQLGAGVPTKQEIQEQLLVADEVVLVFVTDTRSGFVIAIGKDFDCFAALNLDRELYAARDNYFRALDSDPSALSEQERAGRRKFFEQEGTAFARSLLPEPVLSRVKQAQRVTVVGLDLLDVPPFECLYLDGVALGMTHAISYAPGLPAALELLRRDRQPRDRLVAFVGDPDLSESKSYMDLNLDRKTLESIVESWQSGKRSILTRERAQLDGLRSSFSEAIVGQILTHGVRDFDRVSSTGFLLSDADTGLGARIWPESLKGCQMPYLVLATFCQSWRGPIRVGEGEVGYLNEQFLLEGAGCVLTSKSDLPLDSTLEYSRVMHAALASNLPPSEAAKQARLALDASEQWNDPYFHSRLSLVGLGHRPLLAEASPDSSRWQVFALFAGPLSLVVIVATIALRKRNRIGAV